MLFRPHFSFNRFRFNNKISQLHQVQPVFVKLTVVSSLSTSTKCFYISIRINAVNIIMAPDKSKRSRSPVSPPQWFIEFLREFQLYCQQHDQNIREVRLLVQENQQLLRDIVQRNVPIRNSPYSSTAASDNQPRRHRVLPTQHSIPSTSVNSTCPRTTSRKSQAPVASNPSAQASASANTNTARTNAVRDAAVAMPRIPRRSRSPSTPRVCWFHKQFGRASINCIEPCRFTDHSTVMVKTNAQPSAIPANSVQPPIPPNVIPSAATQPLNQPADIEMDPGNKTSLPNPVPAIAVRIPLERSLPVPAAKLSDSSDTDEFTSVNKNNQAGTSNGLKPADWNKLNKDDNRSSSDSSSSDSDSDEPSHDTNQ